MGIQSTVYIKREDAEEKFVQMYSDNALRKLKALAVLLDDKELENEIEEHFYNYVITDDDSLINDY